MWSFIPSSRSPCRLKTASARWLTARNKLLSYRCSVNDGACSCPAATWKVARVRTSVMRIGPPSCCTRSRSSKSSIRDTRAALRGCSRSYSEVPSAMLRTWTRIASAFRRCTTRSALRAAALTSAISYALVNTDDTFTVRPQSRPPWLLAMSGSRSRKSSEKLASSQTPYVRSAAEKVTARQETSSNSTKPGQRSSSCWKMGRPASGSPRRTHSTNVDRQCSEEKWSAR
mmetsp:Transcript_12843/g.41034  ORF Transcript_12843/g.41034 Transcript_12843/m.41034 type:complete len:229 (-) Transcript_12843:443-1129(-)